MRSPYPRDRSLLRAQVEREREAAAASYRAGVVMTFLGAAFALLGLIANSDPAIFLGGVTLVLGVPWKYLAQRQLLRFKGLTWEHCPIWAVHFYFMHWYSSAPDRYPYLDSSETYEAPPPPRGL